MEIQHSIISQALYGENGRVALPINMFMKQSNADQVGGKKKDIAKISGCAAVRYQENSVERSLKEFEHLGVPLIVALVNVNVRPSTGISYNNASSLDLETAIPSSEIGYIKANDDNTNKSCNHTIQYMYDEPIDKMDEYIPSKQEEFVSISDEMYDSLLNNVLDEQIEDDLYSDNVPVKKYTRKNRKLIV
uniref:Uncharacterized protein n=1 Tax=viral metagenome TaxID=1070528 RepID=A0A6C0JX21_9ZZZZ